MKFTLIAMVAVALTGCANLSGPCAISDTTAACDKGGSITVISPSAVDIFKK